MTPAPQPKGKARAVLLLALAVCFGALAAERCYTLCWNPSANASQVPGLLYELQVVHPVEHTNYQWLGPVGQSRVWTNPLTHLVVSNWLEWAETTWLDFTNWQPYLFTSATQAPMDTPGKAGFYRVRAVHPAGATSEWARK